MCNYGHKGVDAPRRRQGEDTETQALAARIAERRRWIRSEQQKRYPSPTTLARLQSQLDGFLAMKGALT